jgi:tetratricopeptide (TPR) repeat protein
VSSYVPLSTGPRTKTDPGRPSAAAGGLKALAFVVLGGVLASALLLALSPETLKGLWSGPEESRPAEQKPEPGAGEPGEAKSADTKASDAKASDAKASDAKASDAKAGDAKAGDMKAGDAKAGDAADGGVVDPSAGDDGAGDVVLVEPRPVDDEPRLAVPATADELVAQAEAALTEKRWREPADGSMALSLANLAIVDPGHEALRRLRRSASAELLPLGEKALDRKRWTEASATFRDLVAVWPDNEVARERLLESLHEEGRVLSKLKDPSRTLAVADELLTMEPTDFPALMLRADSLYALGRFEESKQTYGRAKRENRRSKPAQAGYKRAAAKARANK